jgi:hypothetical protein
MNNTQLTDEEISFFTKGYFNIYPDADSVESFEIQLFQLENFARFLLRKAQEK